MSKKGKLIIISGPSGVGKKTIIDQFINDPELNLEYSISMTTREKRPGEVDGKDYYFVSNEAFDQAIKNNEMLEWADFCKCKYGTKKSEIERIVKNKANALIEIEVVGALKVIEENKDNPDLVSIFIVPPSLEELKNRLVKRGTESEEKIAWRLNRAKDELKIQDKYQYVVVNDDQVRAANEIKEILKGVING